MGAMNFGDRAAMLQLAEERLAAVKKTFPAAQLLNVKDVSVIFLVADDPKKYHTHAVADAAPRQMTRKQFVARLAAPLRGLADTTNS